MAKAMGKYKPGLALGTAILVQLEQQCRMHSQPSKKWIGYQSNQLLFD
jgi:hypothetical protein